MDTLSRINPLHQKFGYLSLVGFGLVLLLLGLFLRTDFFLSIVNFVLEIIGWLGIIGGIAIAAAGIAAYGHERGWWNKIIEMNAQEGSRMPLFRGLSSSALFVLVMMFFFLPWVSVNCIGDEVTASGMNLMAITESDGTPLSYFSPDGEYTVGDAIGSEAALIYLAFLIAIAGAVLFFVPGRSGRYIRAGIGATGILCLLLYILIGLFSLASDVGVSIGELEDFGIETSPKIGLWLTALGYIAAAAIQFVPLPFADGPSE